MQENLVFNINSIYLIFYRFYLRNDSLVIFLFPHLILKLMILIKNVYEVIFYFFLFHSFNSPYHLSDDTHLNIDKLNLFII